MSEFVALASKLYALSDINDHGEKKANGVKKMCNKGNTKVWSFHGCIIIK